MCYFCRDKPDWPDANTLTRRLKRLVDHITRVGQQVHASSPCVLYLIVLSRHPHIRSNRMSSFFVFIFDSPLLFKLESFRQVICVVPVMSQWFVSEIERDHLAQHIMTLLERCRG